MTEIAIVGIGCRFPGGISDADGYWDFLLRRGDGVVPVPRDRWRTEKFYDPDPDAPGRMYTRRAGFLTERLWEFDAEFFGISPREASTMDPQQRVLLEVAWEALDDAGVTPRVGGRQVGVYVGAFTIDNAITRVSPQARPFITNHTSTGFSFTLLSNRISYVLDLLGPSMTIDTACSSSLVAVHQATRAIVDGECDMALAGGVNIILRPETSIAMSKGRFLAADGRSKAFDAAADGYGRGEGAGIVVLKRLDTAQRDGDRIYAVVRGSGINQDGRTSAIPVPNPTAQRDLARLVCARAGIEPRAVAYVEAHGTGTPIGDPIEMSALGAVYGTASGRSGPLEVGSVKATIGHLEAAAGVAGLIKAALVVHHGTVAPQGWLQEPNPQIPFEDLNIVIPTEPHVLSPADDGPLVAVNSFGYGGTNAHVVLGAPPSPPPSPSIPARLPRVLPISGRCADAVPATAERLVDLIESGSDLDAIVGAAWTRRAHHPYRAALDYTDATDLLHKLRSFASGSARPAARAFGGDAAGPVFVFSGMGPQWWGMGRDLLLAGRGERSDGKMPRGERSDGKMPRGERSDGKMPRGERGEAATPPNEFRRMAEAIDGEFSAISGWSIIEELLRPAESSRVTTTAIAQPANFLVQVALTAHLASLGVRPAAVVGHSVGEVSAAYVAGVLSLHDALLVSYHRSRLQATCTGAMLAVGLSESDAVATVPELEALSVAAVNSPSAVTLAGDAETIAALHQRLTDSGIFARKLGVEVGYHSAQMDPILDELRSVLADLDPVSPTVPLYSTVTADRVRGPQWGAQYWCRNVREAVRFADTVSSIIDGGNRVFLEVGPNPVLGGNIRELLVRGGEVGAVIGTLTRTGNATTDLQRSLADLYVAGALDTSAFGDGAPTRHVPLPAYPWQRARMWTESDDIARDRLGGDVGYAMLGDAVEPSRSEWTVGLSVATFPWLHDHVVAGSVVLPGTAYVDAALSAAAVRTGRDDLAVEDLRFVAPLVVGPHDVPVLRVVVDEVTKRFTASSRTATGSAWTVNATGRLVEGPVRSCQIDLPATSSPIRDGADLYSELAARGLEYGSAFRRIEKIQTGADFAVARIDTSIDEGSGHLAHPAALDTALQCVATLLEPGPGTGIVVPAAIGAVRRFGPVPPGTATVLVRRRGGKSAPSACRSLHSADMPLPLADIDILDPDGRQVITMSGVEFRPLAPPIPAVERLSAVFHESEWSLCEPLTRCTERDPNEVAVVVAVGSSARQRAADLAHSHPNAILVEAPASSAPTTDLLATLDTGLARCSSGVVVVVAGEDDAARNVHALARIAAGLASMESEPARPPLRAVLVTEHAFCLPGSSADADLAHAALVGARRSLLNEQPEFRWRLVDAESGTETNELAREVWDGGGDDRVDEVCLRLGARWGLRLRQNLPEHLARLDEVRVVDGPETSFTLDVPESHLFGDFAWREADRVMPAGNEIEVRMEAVGLNPKDAFKVLGVLTQADMAETYFGTGLGLEGDGVVVRTGSDVHDVAVGDRVVVSAPDMIRRHVTIDRARATVVPSHWPVGTCSSTVPFLTAEFALIDVARLADGETVLIQGAAGGVGQAAIQVAKRLGATVIAAAGTDERRTHVLAAGADHAVDSRSLTFVDDVLRVTDGRGVDVVLNSVPGEMLRQNFRVAAEFGRIVDIGKIDIYSDGVIDLRPFDRNLVFAAFDLDRMLNFRPDAVRARMTELVDQFARGIYTHLGFRMHSMDAVATAFDEVARPTRIGRVVLDLRESSPELRPPIPLLRVRPDATYLVTGGFGAFGLATARWLVRAGARNLVLVGRNGPTTERARRQLREFADAGVEVVQEHLDVSDYAAVAAVVGRAAAGSAPLRGVFHAAGVVDNHPVAAITADNAAAVFAPKLDGATHLDRAVRAWGVNLDHFVLWSSVSATVGGFPQVSYSAANSALAALAFNRRRRGEPALCVDWGSMSGGGMAEANTETVRYLSAVGLRPIDLDAACEYLGECLRLGWTHVSIFEMDWQQAAATTYSLTHSTRFDELALGSDAATDEATALAAEILALPLDQRAAAASTALADVLAVVLGVSPTAVDVDTPLAELGIDSLMAVEFAARVAKRTGIEMSPLQVSSALGLGLSGLGARIVTELEAQEAKAA